MEHKQEYLAFRVVCHIDFIVIQGMILRSGNKIPIVKPGISLNRGSTVVICFKQGGKTGNTGTLFSHDERERNQGKGESTRFVLAEIQIIFNRGHGSSVLAYFVF